MKKSESILDKINRTRRQIPNQTTPFKQIIFDIIFIEKIPAIQKIVKILKTTHSHYPLRLSDLFIIFCRMSFYVLGVVLMRNWFNDVMRSSHEFNLKPWFLFIYKYQRQPKELYSVKPLESEVRDLELFNIYKERKNELLFDRTFLGQVTGKDTLEVMPAQDFREIDSTEFQSKIKANFDENVINIIRKDFNKECIEKGAYNNELLYKENLISMKYKASKYKYKDELYSELMELTKI